jgi:hypothetical protein
MQDECYSLLFRKKLYQSLEELQIDVNEWVRKYMKSDLILEDTVTGRLPGRPSWTASTWHWGRN